MTATSSVRIGLAAGVAITLAGMVPATPASASIFLWKGGTGNWKDDKKWQGPRDLPEKDDSVRIQVSGSVVNVTASMDTVKIHDVALSQNTTLNVLGPALEIYGNSLANNGTVYVGPSGFLRSHSKDLRIGGNGTVIMAGEIAGNMTVEAGQTIRGSGAIGRNTDRLFNDGTIVADAAGRNLTFYQAINGVGTFRAQNGGSVVFTRASSSDYLINNARVQVDSDFYVARDYQGSYFYSGNNFDARRTVVGTGRILAADASQVVTGARLAGNVIQFGTLRKGSSVSTDLLISNTGTLTTLRGAVKNLGAANVTVGNRDFVIGAGGSHTASLTFNGTAAGFVGNQTIDVVNNFDNVADGHYTVQATVTDPAVVAFAKQSGVGVFAGSGSDYTLDLGTLYGAAGTLSAELAVINTVLRSSFSESLGGSFSLTGDMGFSFAGTSFSGLLGGDADLGNWLGFDANGLAVGQYNGLLTFNGYSRYPGLSDLTLGPVRVKLKATVASVPEPATWAMMIAGFGAIGGVLRRRSSPQRRYA